MVGTLANAGGFDLRDYQSIYQDALAILPEEQINSYLQRGGWNIRQLVPYEMKTLFSLLEHGGESTLDKVTASWSPPEYLDPQSLIDQVDGKSPINEGINQSLA